MRIAVGLPVVLRAVQRVAPRLACLLAAAAALPVAAAAEVQVTKATAPSVAAPAAPAGAAADRVPGPLREAGPDGRDFVGYVDSATLPVGSLDGWAGAGARTLSQDAASGRRALRVRFPAGWKLPAAPLTAQSLEIVMLEGELQFGTTPLGRYDFAFVPPGVAAPAFASPRGAAALLFFDPPAPDAAAVARQRERGSYVTRFDPARWQPASLARAAGATIDLRVMHLKKDPFTTARTWYVKLGPGMRMPWEVHSMVEEGYVMEGGYTLAECLPTRTVIGDYGQGGYFWRPGGIPHSGPESGPVGDVVWLQRSPVALDVTLFGRCVDGRASAAVTP